LTSLHRRVATAAIIAMLAILTTIALPSISAQAHGPTTRMLDWNARGGGAGALHLYNRLRPSIEARGVKYPGIVTLQEVCRAQADRIQSYMTFKGYSWYAMYTALSPTSDTTCDVADDGSRSFGNFVWVRGAANGTQWESNPYSSQLPGKSEKRGMACIGPTPYGIWPCTTHLAPADYQVADCQAEEAFDLMENGYALGRRGVIAGDFNIRSQDIGSNSYLCTEYPHQHPAPSVLSWAYSQYWEADQYSGTDDRATHDSEGKIDYIFFKKGWGEYFADLSINLNSYSDHHLLEAYLAS
jgi:endonuclease/exonuclease/phosphatase family metal-dependent hydrolase